ncbi:MAG TPA: hypothetical protein VGB74_10525, partial [Actinoplanes sp.]
AAAASAARADAQARADAIAARQAANEAAADAAAAGRSAEQAQADADAAGQAASAAESDAAAARAAATRAEADAADAKRYAEEAQKHADSAAEAAEKAGEHAAEAQKAYERAEAAERQRLEDSLEHGSGLTPEQESDFLNELTPEERAEYEAAKAERDQGFLDFVKENGLEILGDLVLGEILTCVKTPSFGACFWAVVELIPWSKIKKLKNVWDIFKKYKTFAEKARNAGKKQDDLLEKAKQRKKNREGTEGCDAVPLAALKSTRVLLDDPAECNIPPKDKAAPQKARSALNSSGWTSKSHDIGGGRSVLLNHERMVHIMNRHMPEYWDGSRTGTQTFFLRTESIDDVTGYVGSVVRQHQAQIREYLETGRGPSQFIGTIGDRKFTLGMRRDGTIGQFYPL